MYHKIEHQNFKKKKHRRKYLQCRLGRISYVVKKIINFKNDKLDTIKISFTKQKGKLQMGKIFAMCIVDERVLYK